MTNMVLSPKADRPKTIVAVWNKKSGQDVTDEQDRLQPLLLKVCRDGAEVTCSGRVSKKCKATPGNALSPAVDSQQC